jgi:predicted dehydrogenase
MTGIPCAVVGLGAIGAEHAAVLAASPLAELACCCDSDPDAARRVPRGVPFTTSLEQALAVTGLRAVFVCTPQSTHLAVARRALEADLAVFCEKPIAAELADADALVAAAERTGGVLAIGHVLRFDPRYRQLLDAPGALGEPIQLAAGRFAPRHEGELLADRTSLAVELAVHDIDVMRAIGGEIDRVYAESGSPAVLGSRPGALSVALRFASGAVGSIDVNWLLPGGDGPEFTCRLEVVGARGSASIALRDAEASTGLLAREDEHFLAMLDGGPGWPVSLTDARETLRVALAIDRSLALGQAVNVSTITEEGP